jgi:hypothetical protein
MLIRVYDNRMEVVVQRHFWACRVVQQCRISFIIKSRFLEESCERDKMLIDEFLIPLFVNTDHCSSPSGYAIAATIS